jgi:hypothetical protein
VWSEQIAFGGIYLPLFLGFLVATGLVYLLLQPLLVRSRAHRLFWHPALAGAALFVIVLAGLLLAFGP